jgi:uncharacterized protein (TIGR00251 family)
MKERSYHLHDGQSGAAITVRIIPRSSRNEISEILEDGTVKIRLTAPQNEEKSNQALIAFLSDVLGVKPKQLEVVAGLSGNDKLITIMDMDKAAVQERILAHLT